MALKDRLHPLKQNRPPEIGGNAATPVPEFYANTVLVNTSPFEFELQHLLVDSQKQVKGAVNIRLSPQTAWTLARALDAQLLMYERMNGEIALPDEIKKSLKG